MRMSMGMGMSMSMSMSMWMWMWMWMWMRMRMRMRSLPAQSARTMLTLYKIALAPALLMQGARLRRTALRLPEAAGPRSGRVGAGDAAPLRLLFIGDSSAAGVGVDWQHEAMPQQAAEMVATALRRPVRWQLVARSGVNTREATALVLAQPLDPADVVISALGVNDVTSQRGAAGFVADYAALLRVTRERTGALQAVVCGLPPMQVLPAAPQPLRWYLGQCATRLDRALQRFCVQQGRLRFLSLGWAQAHEMARDRFHPGQLQYRRWAELVAQQVVAAVQPRG
jgi:lysophospholipase L1-like esterase